MQISVGKETLNVLAHRATSSDLVDIYMRVASDLEINSTRQGSGGTDFQLKLVSLNDEAIAGTRCGDPAKGHNRCVRMS